MVHINYMKIHLWNLFSDILRRHANNVISEVNSSPANRKSSITTSWLLTKLYIQGGKCFSSCPQLWTNQLRLPSIVWPTCLNQHLCVSIEFIKIEIDQRSLFEAIFLDRDFELEYKLYAKASPDISCWLVSVF